LVSGGRYKVACGRGGGRSQFGRLERKPGTLYTLWYILSLSLSHRLKRLDHHMNMFFYVESVFYVLAPLALYLLWHGKRVLLTFNIFYSCDSLLGMNYYANAIFSSSQSHRGCPAEIQARDLPCGRS
jgi:hypothetical protein